MADYDIYSDEDSSIGPPPPPPPPADLPKGPSRSSPTTTQKSQHPYEERLRVYDSAAEFGGHNDGNDNYRETDFMMDHNFEDGGSNDYKYRSNSGRDDDDNNGRKPAMLAAFAICILVVLAIVLGWGFGTGAFLEKDSGNASAAPPDRSSNDGNREGGRPTTARGGRLYDFLSAIVTDGEDAFANPTSPEGKALAWLADEDPMQLDPADPASEWRINQRFALVTLYYTSVFEWFDQTNWMVAENECDWHGVECSVLEPSDVRRSLQEQNADPRPVVTTLNLESNNLQGPIPNDLHLLRYLITLNLAKNQLVGTLPTAIDRFVFLEELYLDSNQMEGDLEGFAFPAGLIVLDLSNNQFSGRLENLPIWSTTTLEMVILDNNKFTGGVTPQIVELQMLSTFQIRSHPFFEMRLITVLPLLLFYLLIYFIDRFTAGGNELRGPVPPQFGFMPFLEVVWLNDNALSGQIPAQIAGAQNLAVFDVASNRLSGFIPTSLTNLPNLSDLILSGNFLSGQMPFEMSSMTELVRFHAEDNWLSGFIPSLDFAEGLEELRIGNNYFEAQPFPDFVTALPALKDLRMNNCTLTGQFPWAIGNITELVRLDLHDNFLWGQIPFSIANNQGLKEMSLHDNQLSGFLPIEITFLSDLERLSLSNNFIEGELPESLGSLKSLISLYLEDNSFSGPLPVSVGGMESIEVIDLRNNNFTGNLPETIVECGSLSKSFSGISETGTRN